MVNWLGRKVNGIHFAAQGQMNKQLRREGTGAAVNGIPIDLELAGIRLENFLFWLIAGVALVVSDHVVPGREFGELIEPALGALVVRAGPGERYFRVHCCGWIASVVPVGPPVPR